MKKVDSILKTPLGNYLITVLKPVDGYKFDDNYVFEEVLVPHDGLCSFIDSYFEVKEFYDNGNNK